MTYNEAVAFLLKETGVHRAQVVSWLKAVGRTPDGRVRPFNTPKGRTVTISRAKDSDGTWKYEVSVSPKPGR